MSKLEKDLERRVVTYAQKRGVLVTKMNLMGRRGFPDRVFWIAGGQPLLLEFKRLGERPTKLQQRTIDQLEKLDYDVEVVDNYEYAVELLGLES